MGLQHVFFVDKDQLVDFCCAYETLSPFSNWEEPILVEVGVSLQLTGQLPFGQLGGS